MPAEPEKRENPRYYGMHKHVDKEGGYALWLPAGWHRFDMVDGHHGVIYSPYPDSFDTSFSAEKHTLEYAVTPDDVPTLREGFKAGLAVLPGVEVESQDESVTSTLITLEARFTFLEGEARRKRWVRIVYWGEGQLVLIAQGSSAGEFEHWLPMFFNTMMTVEIG
jgi:hypothetical protein